MSKTRKDRSDIQVGNLETKHNLEPGTIRNTDQTDARSDKELGSLHREYGEQAVKNMIDEEDGSAETNGEKSDK